MDEKEFMLKEVIGKNIHRLRKEKGWTQEQLAEKVNRTPGSMSHIETGTSSLGVELLVMMADLFSVSVDELVRAENTTPHFQNICNLLTAQPDDTLAKLEPFIRLWISQYGESPSPKEN